MRKRVLLVPVLAGLLVLAGVLGIQDSRAAAPQLTLSVNLNGSLEVVLGNGTRIRTSNAPGATISPGPYLAIVGSDVPDSQDVYHMFHLAGPGVNLSSELLPCENPMPLLTVTLQPSSTYTYDDLRHPELTHVVFTTSAGGSSSDSSGGSSGPATAKSTGSVSNSSVVGSALANIPFRGTLVGTVRSARMLTLSHNGNTVSSLKAGRYKIAVDDETTKGGFTIGGVHKQSVMVTGSSFVGKRTATVYLRAGRWMYYSSAGPKHHFAVVA